MKYCTHCGKELIDEADYCTNCGCKATNLQSEQQPLPNDKPIKGSGLGFVLSFFLGILGLILAICLGDEECKKTAIKTFVICAIVSVAIVVITVITVMIASATTYY